MATRTINRAHIPVSADYDRRADVLYVVLGDDRACEGEGLSNGVELNYDIANGKPSGATVIGFHRNKWDVRIAELATVISRHLVVADMIVSTAIKRAVNET
jgi:hypothetical protein